MELAALAFLDQMNGFVRIGIIFGIAILAHLSVILLRRGSDFLVRIEALLRPPKARSVIGLITIVAIFGLYFAFLGFCLSEMGISLTAYFASAAVIRMAACFRSQWVVQDVVTGSR